MLKLANTIAKLTTVNMTADLLAFGTAGYAPVGMPKLVDGRFIPVTASMAQEVSPTI